MPVTQVRGNSTGNDIQVGSIIGTDLAANAAIVSTQISGTAVTQTGGGVVTGTVDVSGGTLLAPQGTGTAPTAAGSVFFKTNTNTLSVGDGTTAHNIVDVSNTQTLTNKTLTAPVIATIVNTGTLTLPTSTDTLVGRATTDTLTNKTLTAPVIATIVNTGTLTLPTSTDTLVGRATTDTLTNKTLTAPVIATIVNTGTLTLPTSTDTLVGRATTDTLTNKTLSGGILTTSVALNTTMTMNASGVLDSTSGVLIVPTGTVNPASVSNGRLFWNSSSQKLLIDDGTVLEKVAGWKLLAAVSLSGAAATLSSGTIAARKHLEIRIRIPGFSAATNAELQFNGDTGANYSYEVQDDLTINTSATGTTGIFMYRTAIATPVGLWTARIRNVAAQAKATQGWGSLGSEVSGTAPTRCSSIGVWGNTAAQITSVVLNGNGANLNSGTEMIIWGRDDE